MDCVRVEVEMFADEPQVVRRMRCCTHGATPDTVLLLAQGPVDVKRERPAALHGPALPHHHDAGTAQPLHNTLDLELLARAVHALGVQDEQRPAQGSLALPQPQHAIQFGGFGQGIDAPHVTAPAHGPAGGSGDGALGSCVRAGEYHRLHRVLPQAADALGQGCVRGNHSRCFREGVHVLRQPVVEGVDADQEVQDALIDPHWAGEQRCA